METYSRQNASNKLAACHSLRKGQVDTSTFTVSRLVLELQSFQKDWFIYAHDIKRIQTTLFHSFSKIFGPLFISGELE